MQETLLKNGRQYRSHPVYINPINRWQDNFCAVVSLYFFAIHPTYKKVGKMLEKRSLRLKGHRTVGTRSGDTVDGVQPSVQYHGTVPEHCESVLLSASSSL